MHQIVVDAYLDPLRLGSTTGSNLRFKVRLKLLFSLSAHTVVLCKQNDYSTVEQDLFFF